MTQDELEQKVRALGTLAERLEECQRRIGNMCSELRIPKMTVPPSYKDDDIFICVTLRDALDDVKRLDSGTIQTHDRDEFGDTQLCIRNGLNLREGIYAAISKN